MKSLKKIAILISGGLDSSILLSHILERRYKIYPIYVKNGNYWEEVELACLKKLLRSAKSKRIHNLISLDLPTQDLYRNFWAINGRKTPDAHSQDKAVYLPGRNILLIAKTATFCAQNKIHQIALASLKTNPFNDATPNFFKQYSRLLSQALNHPIQIKAPFITKTKKEVMKIGRRMRLDLTFSCIRPKGKLHCGLCNKCAERRAAFKTVSLADPTHYAA